jgi:hypothetical protein
VSEAGVGAPHPVFVVCSSRGVEQVFTDSAAAYRFADELPGCWVSQHVLRSSDEEAVMVIDRRVVVVAGQTRADETKRFWCFPDESVTMPTADVEWFCEERTGEWHIVGFGTDDSDLDASMRQAIEHVLTLIDAAARANATTNRADRPAPQFGYVLCPYTHAAARPTRPFGRWSGWSRNTAQGRRHRPVSYQGRSGETQHRDA